MQSKILKALFNCVDISGEFIPVSEAALLKDSQLSKEQLDELTKQLIKQRFITAKKCLTGRNFYCLTKRGETKMNEKV